MGGPSGPMLSARVAVPFAVSVASRLRLAPLLQSDVQRR
ncbi:DUF6053 domain-containing protein [Lysobacter yananisis]